MTEDVQGSVTKCYLLKGVWSLMAVTPALIAHLGCPGFVCFGAECPHLKNTEFCPLSPHFCFVAQDSEVLLGT